MTATSSMTPSRDDFEAMLDESFNANQTLEGTVIKGKIISIENDLAIIDVGLKTEGRGGTSRILHAGFRRGIVGWR